MHGLAPGRYTLTIDGKAVATAPADEWAKGVTLDHGPDFDQAEQLRQAIVAKNRLYFYRWRPANETYLFGFRKQEQGQNAIEIPKFDPLVVEKEQEIAKLRVPTAHTYELNQEAQINELVAPSLSLAPPASAAARRPGVRPEERPGQRRSRPGTGTQVVPGRRRLRGQPLRRRPAAGQADGR